MCLRPEDPVSTQRETRQRSPDKTRFAWNTIYTERVIDQLRTEGQLITASEVERISPLPYQHIHAYGD